MIAFRHMFRLIPDPTSQEEARLRSRLCVQLTRSWLQSLIRTILCGASNPDVIYRVHALDTFDFIWCREAKGSSCASIEISEYPPKISAYVGRYSKAIEPKRPGTAFPDARPPKQRVSSASSRPSAVRGLAERRPCWLL